MLISAGAFAQQISGAVLDESNQSLPGVNVFWAGTTIGTVTNEGGEFSINKAQKLPAKLVFSFVGYKTDTVDIHHSSSEEIKIQLKNTVELQEVTVEGKQQTTKISTMSSINIESISSGELKKAACCNLSESFETNASVDVVFSDAVSGAKKIQMLGLDGIYTQIMFENIPLVRGLGSSYGLNYVPGTWIESIQITKGTGSVVNGYESITGQINLEYWKPDESDKLFVNLYGNHNGRSEANVHYVQKLSPKWSTLLFAHGSNVGLKNDHNKDGFLDMPLSTQVNIFNRWKRVSQKMMTQFGVSALWDEKTGGQTEFNYEDDFGNQTLYGVGINSKQMEVYGKNGFLFPESPYKSVGLMASARIHQQDAFFGLKKYSGKHQSVYFNAIYQSIISTTAHKYKTGMSFQLDDYSEAFNDSAFTRTELVPGAFLEYTYGDSSTVSLVAGVRADYHNLYGLQINPRAHFKYNIKPLTSLRISAGKGFRTANIFAENPTIFASSRDVIVKEQLLPEEAINAGISFTHKFNIFDRDASFNLDYYRTEFLNQVVVDLDKNPQKVYFYNLNGKSFSDSYQADFTIQPVERIDVKLAYKHYNVKTTYSEQLLQKPLVPKDRALFNIAYETGNKKWKFDFTANWFGKSRLPNTSSNPEAYRLDGFSDEYFTLNAQITKVFKHFEWYLGGENLLNYKQPNAILAANDPFGKHFDASLIWGPVNGRVIYSGIKYNLK